LISDLQEQEMTLKQCIEQLESVDAARISLINQLKEALSEQVLRLSLPLQCSISITCLVLFRTVCFSYMTGVKVSGSSQPVASKNYSLSYRMLLSFSFVVISLQNHVLGHSAL